MRTTDVVHVQGARSLGYACVESTWITREGSWLIWRVIGMYGANIRVHEESYAGRDVRQWRLRFAAAQLRAREAIEAADRGEWPEFI
jgi:hypothetical protein